MPKCITEIRVEDPEWSNTMEDVEKLANTAAQMTIDTARLPEGADQREIEISIVLADNQIVQSLNAQYRNINKPTNVLSFALLDDAEEAKICKNTDQMITLGDIVLARETLLQEAKEQDKSPKDHFCHLVVHGILHLLGYDHIEKDDAHEMETLEQEILDSMGISNPYTTIDDGV